MFNISAWTDDTDSRIKSGHVCGTAGCAVGWGAMIGFGDLRIRTDDTRYAEQELSWWEYKGRILNGLPEEDFEYLFGYKNHYAEKTKSRQSCVDRITQYLTENNY